MHNGKKPGRRRLLRFSLRTLLVVVTCVAAFLAGHRTGFDAGYREAEEHYGVDDWPLDVSDCVIPLPEDVPMMLDGGSA
jgi:hypothetical protein